MATGEEAARHRAHPGRPGVHQPLRLPHLPPPLDLRPAARLDGAHQPQPWQDEAVRTDLWV